jgi:hypothetical protein
VLAVLVGLQTTPLNLSHSFIADYTRRYYNRSVTNGSLTNCVDCSPFPSTLLTIDYFRWRPTIHCRLSALVVSSLASYSLHTLTDCHARLSLKWADADGRGDTMSHRLSMHCDGLVTGETSVVHFTLHSSGFILGIANRNYRYAIRNHLSVEWQRHRFPGIRLYRQQRRYIRLLDSSDNLRIGSPSHY